MKPASVGRGRKLLLTSLLGFFCLIIVFGLYWWARPATPEPPVIDLSGVDPAVVKTIEESRSAVQQSPRSAAAWGRLGQVLLAHGLTSEARNCFAQAERLDPGEPRWPYYQGYILSLENPTAALPEWRRALELGGDEQPVARLRLGAALLDLGRTDEAEAEIRSALQAQPGDPSALVLLGRTEYAQGKYRECLRDLDEAAKSPATRKTALTAAAAARRRLGEAGAAAKELQLAADLPDDPPMPDPFLEEAGQLQRGKQAILKRAEQALSAGKVAEAVQWFRDLVRDYPEVDWAWLRLGRALFQEGDNSGAERALRAGLERNPNLVEGHFYLGVLLYQQGDYHDAAASFRRAAELKPDHALAQFNLGECLLKEGDLDGAQRAFQAAVESKPAFSDAHAELAVVAARAGRRAQANEEAHEALRLDPSNPKAKKILEDLAGP